MPSGPTGYQEHYVLAATDRRCLVGVGLDVDRGTVLRFLVQLLRTTPGGTVTEIARIDHNPSNPLGHDVRREGVHVDVLRSDGSEVTLHPSQSQFDGTGELGSVVDLAVHYLAGNATYFLDVRDGTIDPRDPPNWPI